MSENNKNKLVTAIDCATIATLLHMNTSDCAIDTQNGNISGVCKEEFNGDLYQSEVVPVLDMLYFTKKLDLYVNRLLGGGIQVVTAVDELHSDKQLDNLFKGTNFKYEWTSIEPTLGKNTPQNEGFVGNIVNQEFEKNREYLDENMASFSGRDILTTRILGSLDQYKRSLGRNSNYVNKFAEAKKRGSDGRRLIDPIFVKSCYEKTGLVVCKKRIIEQNWRKIKDLSKKLLYDQMITKRGLGKVISFKDFEDCLISAIKSTAYFMQNGIEYYSSNERL